MNQHPLITWLDILHAMVPMNGTLFIGAGAGNGTLAQWLKQVSPPTACLVEADPSLYQYLQQAFSTVPNWECKHETVSPSPEAVRFHKISNGAESGLLPVSLLQGLWPNLSDIHEEASDGNLHVGITLADLMAGFPGNLNWLILDCMPATTLLQGAGSAVSEWDVILARVVVDESLVKPGAHFSTTNHLLKQKGFHCIHLHSERHPAIALAMFVRDVRAAQNTARAEQGWLELQQNELKELQQQIDALSQAKAAAEQLAADRQKQLEETISSQLELAARQNLMRQELTETESQVDFLKNLLIKDADR